MSQGLPYMSKGTRILRWEHYPGFSIYAQQNHKGPYTRGRSETDVTKEARDQREVVQKTWEASRSWKRTRDRFVPRAPETDFRLLTLEP